MIIEKSGEYTIGVSKYAGGGESYSIHWYYDGHVSYGFVTASEAHANARRFIGRHPEIFATRWTPPSMHE